MSAFVTYPGQEFFDRYLELRYSVLRAPLGLPPGSEQDESDHYDTTRHLVWLDDDEQAQACVQLQAAEEQGTARVRYMAVAAEAQGRGLGRQLLDFLEQLAAEEGYHTLYLNARENAVLFYLACGYARHDEIAPFYGIRHWRMSRRIA